MINIGVTITLFTSSPFFVEDPFVKELMVEPSLAYLHSISIAT